MTDLKEAVNKVSKRLAARESKRQRLSSAVRRIGNQNFRIGGKTQDRLINEVARVPVTGRFAGVDGGLLSRSFHGIDLIVTRAVGVIFDYKEGTLAGSSNLHADLKVIDVESGGPGELVLLAGLSRMEAELDIALQTLEHQPDYLLMDGPLYPHPSTRVAKASHAKTYRTIIRKYDLLVRRSRATGCRLVGVVEDSRSRYFSNLLCEVIIPNLPPEVRASFPEVQTFRDTVLLYDTLAHRQRTFIFKLKEVPDVAYGKDIYAFYIKTAPHDRPIRVELVTDHPQEDGETTASAILGLSTFSTYGIPSVIIEADARAKLSEPYMDYIERMMGRTTPLLMRLRREGRPI
ncbi:MAG TPA: DNA double-strand break repair nuclease NurA [archaeon]|nr:DNA double-strand break repair nuclease NurA [archaeon]